MRQKQQQQQSFQKWLKQLSWRSLEPLLEFELDETEQQLFGEMLRLQAPPPTPIHPRAIPYTRCQSEASDGRDPIVQRRRGIRSRPRWFRFVQDGSSGKLLVQARNFEGDAKTRVLQRLTIGCTREQMELDKALQDGTAIVLGRSGRLGCRFIGSMPYRYRERGVDNEYMKQSFIRMLKVASRGHFASVPSSSNTSWLQTTRRWFPLSMYLACRFEAALWKSYRGAKPCSLTDDAIPLSGLMNLPQQQVLAHITVAVGTSFREHVLERVNMQQLQDSLMGNLLEGSFSRLNQASAPKLHSLSLIRSIPLVCLDDMADERKIRFRRAIFDRLLELAAAITTQALLGDDDFITLTTSHHDAEKKKNRKKKYNQKPKIVQEKVVSEALKIQGDFDPDDGESDDDTVKLVLSYPKNNTSSRQRNRNAIFALSIVNDVISSVFEHVGLPASPPQSPPRNNDLSQSAELITADVDETKALLSINFPEMHVATEHLSSPKLISQQANMLPDDSSDELAVPPDEEALVMKEFLVPLESIVNGRQEYVLCEDSQLGQFAIPVIYPMNSTPVYRPESDTGHAGNEVSLNQASMVWEVSDAALDHWGRDQGFASREKSIFAELFPGHERVSTVNNNKEEGVATISGTPTTTLRVEKTNPSPEHAIEGKGGDTEPLEVESKTEAPPSSPSKVMGDGASIARSRSRSSSKNNVPEMASVPSSQSFPSVKSTRPKRSTSMSRDDLLALLDASNEKKIAIKVSRSALTKSRDDHDIQRQRRSIDALSSYRLVVVKNKPTKAKDDHDIRATVALKAKAGNRSPGTSSLRYVMPRASPGNSSFIPLMTSVAPPEPAVVDSSRDFCARSETLEGATDMEPWIDRPHSFDDDDNHTRTAKDETTTITSAPSHHESEEVLRLREERNAYRDLCLTLRAEVGKLTNLLASQKVSSGQLLSMPRGPYHPNLKEPIFDPESVANGFGSTRARTLAAMSDAGLRAEHESLASEDTGAILRPGMTMADSDWSIDQASAAIPFMHFQFPSCIMRAKDSCEPVSRTGMQSRLSLDIWQFVDSTHSQLQKQSRLRQTAVERMVRLVTTLWPRAQVKLYGSHVTGVCLPSSDVDFIICLPAVHKKAVAVAPGVLEGRNAINESAHKLLYRKLKAESWVDPRSIKLIERTVVPVIKVSTRETKGRTLQLDITFDAPGHHGLAAVELVTTIVEDLPMIRPIVLVLKQFLINKSLLTAYTGGLSSYCLFLMVARYLQEQPSVYGDVGALLIGFLDFFGNHFDPRTTGLSVRRSEYFTRPMYSMSRFQPASEVAVPVPAMWQPTTYMGHDAGNTQFFRRNSFSEKGSGDMTILGPPMLARSPRLSNAPDARVSARPMYVPAGAPMDSTLFEHRVSYNFDPLWVEDPLSESNNVGRNAFRYLQVQRAFSDAHRALVAALEWEVLSATDGDNETEYPLLKCLLQSEDLVFDL